MQSVNQMVSSNYLMSHGMLINWISTFEIDLVSEHESLPWLDFPILGRACLFTDLVLARYLGSSIAQGHE
jgi:hypothetical protein